MKTNPNCPRPDRLGHELPWDYSRGCRCTPAREASRIRRKRIRHGIAEPFLVDATGTVRRLRALQRLGWSGEEIGIRLGISGTAVRKMWGKNKRAVLRSTAASVQALYDELSMTVGPSELTRKKASLAGYLPPLAWDDDRIDDPTYRPSKFLKENADPDHAVVSRCLAGMWFPPMNRAEVREFVRRAYALGWTDQQMADRLGIQADSVRMVRVRQRLRREAA